MRSLLIAAFLSACTLSIPADRAPTTAERIAAECRLLGTAASRMAAAAAPAHVGLREGCEGISSTDTRPLARQTASLRAAQAASLPATVPAGSRAEVVFRRLITRGVPTEIAASLAETPDFRIAGTPE